MKFKEFSRVQIRSLSATEQTTETGNVLVPKASESFWHDLDGNLLSDSLWTNTWNAGNRMIRVQSAAGVSAAGARMKGSDRNGP